MGFCSSRTSRKTLYALCSRWLYLLGIYFRLYRRSRLGFYPERRLHKTNQTAGYDLSAQNAVADDFDFLSPHDCASFLVLLAFSEISISGLFMAALGLLVNCIAVLGAGTILVLYSVRNRDIPVLVNLNFPDFVSDYAYNLAGFRLGHTHGDCTVQPFFHMIEAIRSPILGGSLEVWLGYITVILICSVPLLMVSLWLLSRQKDELNFYL